MSVDRADFLLTGAGWPSSGRLHDDPRSQPAQVLLHDRLQSATARERRPFRIRRQRVARCEDASRSWLSSTQARRRPTLAVMAYNRATGARSASISTIQAWQSRSTRKSAEMDAMSHTRAGARPARDIRRPCSLRDLLWKRTFDRFTGFDGTAPDGGAGIYVLSANGRFILLESSRPRSRERRSRLFDVFICDRVDTDSFAREPRH